MATPSLKNKIRHQALHIVYWQLAGVLLLTSATLPFRHWQLSIGVIAGGFAYGIANLCFVWLVFRYDSAKQMTQFMAAFFIGEMIKLFFSGLLVLIIVKTLPVSLLSVLVGFIGAIVAFWIACLRYFSKQIAGSTSNLNIVRSS